MFSQTRVRFDNSDQPISFARSKPSPSGILINQQQFIPIYSLLCQILQAVFPLFMGLLSWATGHVLTYHVCLCAFVVDAIWRNPLRTGELTISPCSFWLDIWFSMYRKSGKRVNILMSGWKSRPLCLDVCSTFWRRFLEILSPKLSMLIAQLEGWPIR